MHSTIFLTSFWCLNSISFRNRLKAKNSHIFHHNLIISNIFEADWKFSEQMFKVDGFHLSSLNSFFPTT